MIYFYSIIARPYCMIPFLLSCISVVYKNKKEHPYLYAILIGLLAHTHLVMVPTSILLCVFFWGEELILKHKIQTKESKKTLIKSLLLFFIIISLYGIIAILTLSNCEILTNFDKTEKIKEIKNAFSLIKNAFEKELRYFYGAKKVPNYYTKLLIITLILCIIGTKNDLKQGIIFWSQFIFTILIHAFFWITTPTRTLIIIYTLMFYIWNYKEDKKCCKKNILLQIALVLLIVITIPGAYKIAYQDIKGNVSTGKVTAKYIKENIPENSCFVCLYNELQQSIVAYLKKDSYKFYMVNYDEPVTFNTWDKRWNTGYDTVSVVKLIERLKNEYKNVYIINIMPTEFSFNYGINLIYSSKDEQIDNIYANDEIFYIYEFNENS